ncbi:MAG TPA: glycosyltransferase [Solirubrobacteraceae bacterium]|nr:glycosyltransferase [Solirubrobacteraceae bacterium]
MADPLHVLVLVDRDWTHPEAGGTGTNLYGQVSRWVAWGHRVTVVAGSYPGAAAHEKLDERLEVHRVGTRLTVFPRAAWLVWRRKLARDADVTLEVVNGIPFFTPLWLRTPRVALVHHVHRRMYVAELGRRGALAALALETLPLRFLYRATPFTTVSRAARDDLVALGVPESRVEVVHNGVESDRFHPGRAAPDPTLLYLGRLKRYKRIEHVLDVLQAVPGARLEIAGDGDHRPALEAEIERRGLGERVTMHGFVDEERKVELYGRAWVALTASSAEGWCLTVMEAAACGTPSVALRVGGLPEAIVDGRTGFLADSVDELAERVGETVADGALRERLGDAALERARTFTWERTAHETLHVLEAQRTAERQALRGMLAQSETAKALGLAAAVMAANVVSLLFTVVFARVLGTEGYGSLAALVSTFLILSVPGLALQVAAARETALGRLGAGGRLAATHRRWMLELGGWALALLVLGVVLRDPLAHVIGVPDEPWAAAAVPVTGVAWLALSIERGMLQGVRAYKAAGLSVILEATGRLVLALALVGGGLDVTGAYLASPLAMAAAALILATVLRRRLGQPARDVRPRRFQRLVAGAWAPVLGLTLVAVLQNIDVIIVKHRVGGDEAGAYAAAAVAAKVVIWVGLGLAYYLVPEAARRAQAGLNPRGVLTRALAIVLLLAAPMLAVYGAVPGFVLQAGFDVDVAGANGALVVLGAAMTLLAVASLAVQYMLAIEHYAFMWLLAVVAAIEPFLLSNAGDSLVGLAALVLALQCLAAGGMLALSFRAPRRPAPALP